MFFVYHGYVSPDNYDSSEKPTYRLSQFNTTDEVLAHHKEFLEDLHNECCNEIYRVFSGEELMFKPVQIVTDFKLSST